MAKGKGKSKSSAKTEKSKAMADMIARAQSQNPTPMGGDSLNPMSAPQPGDPSTKLFANPEQEQA